MREGTYREQPTMNFSHKMLIYLTTTTPHIADPVLQGWSTVPAVNDLLGNYLTVPTVRVRDLCIQLLDHVSILWCVGLFCCYPSQLCANCRRRTHIVSTSLTPTISFISFVIRPALSMRTAMVQQISSTWRASFCWNLTSLCDKWLQCLFFPTNSRSNREIQDWPLGPTFVHFQHRALLHLHP